MPVPCLLKRYAKLGPSWPIFPVLGCKSGLEQRDGTALRAPSTLDALSGGLDSCETEENKWCARGCDTTSRAQFFLGWVDTCHKIDQIWLATDSSVAL